LISREGHVQPLAFGDPALGCGGHGWRAHEVPLWPGDTLVLHTDGLTECSRDIAQGEARLRDALAELASSKETITAHAVLERTLGGIAPRDDIAIVVVRITTIDPLCVTVPAEPGQCSKVRETLRSFLERCPLDADQRYDMLVAAGEATANAIEHPQDRDDNDVVVRASLDDDAVVVTVHDRGRWAMGKSPSPRGRGIPLMHALVDKVEISNDPRGTFVELRTALRRRPALEAVVW
jgi:anti-sigma regulatory factor (Ser/Thr protein kinase)